LRRPGSGTDAPENSALRMIRLASSAANARRELKTESTRRSGRTERYQRKGIEDQCCPPVKGPATGFGAHERSPTAFDCIAGIRISAPTFRERYCFKALCECGA